MSFAEEGWKKIRDGQAIVKILPEPDLGGNVLQQSVSVLVTEARVASLEWQSAIKIVAGAALVVRGKAVLAKKVVCKKVEEKLVVAFGLKVK